MVPVSRRGIPVASPAAREGAVMEDVGISATMCEAFQATVARRPDELVALRTAGGAGEITWAEYADRVRADRRRAGGARRRPGDTVGADDGQPPGVPPRATPPRCTSARRRSRSTTRSPPEQIAYLFANAGNRWSSCEAQFLDRRRGGRPARDRVEPRRRASTAPRRGHDHAGASSRPRGDPAFDFEAAWRAVGPDDVADADLHVGHHRPAQGRRAHARQHARRAARRSTRSCRSRPGRPVHLLPAARRTSPTAGAATTSAHDRRRAGHLRAPTRSSCSACCRRCRPTSSGRRAADLGEAQGRRSRPGSPREPTHAPSGGACALDAIEVGARRAGRAASRPASRSRTRLAAAVRAGRRGGLGARSARRLGLDQVRVGCRRRGADRARGAEFFSAIGLPIGEVWGMSELSCCGTMQPARRGSRSARSARRSRACELRSAERRRAARAAARS